jgi:hypothetical protein
MRRRKKERAKIRSGKSETSTLLQEVFTFYPY